MDRSPTRFAILGIVLLAVGIAGCKRGESKDGPAELQVVTVSVPVVRDVSDYVDFTGRTAAVESVDVRARVTGYLDKVAFEEGVEVAKDDLLFNIDPRPFQAQYDQTVAEIKVRQANLEDQRAELARAQALLPKNAISHSDFDKIAAQHGEAVASVAAAEAAAEAAKLNLEFATIRSPISGRISRTDITAGNLVNADVTLLTTVVSQDPIYVYFDVDEHTLLRIVRMQLNAKENLLRERKVPLLIGLPDEEGYPHRGFVNFADNVVDSSTGTVTARGVFANPAGPSGIRLLRPGMFVRVRLPLGGAQKALLVAERALATDQGRKYLLVVDEQHKVQYRPVSTGPLQDDGLRVVADGLSLSERVIVSGLQLVRPKMEVKVEEVPMPQQTASPPAAVPRAATPPAVTPPAATAPAEPAPAATASAAIVPEPVAPAREPAPAAEAVPAPDAHR